MEEKKLKQLTKKVLIQMLLDLEEKTKVIEDGIKIESVPTEVEKPKLEVFFVYIEEIISFGRLIALRKKMKTNEDNPSRTPSPFETRLLIEEYIKEMAEKGFIYTGAPFINIMGTTMWVFYKLI